MTGKLSAEVTRQWRDTQQTATAGRVGRRLVYGGHVISLARALLFNGLANAFKVAAPNGGRHIAPTFCRHCRWASVIGAFIC